MTDAVLPAPAESVLPTPAGYLRQATLPWPSLLMLAPLILAYEVGTSYFTTAALHGKDQQIIAFSKMQEFFRALHASGRHMPAAAVLVMLLACHVARNDRWTVPWRTLIGMVVESILLGLPLLLVAFLVNRFFPLVGLRASPASMQGSIADRLIMDIGAGVYEEFVFRLGLFMVMSLLFTDLLKVPERRAHLLMVVTSGILFSLYHYWSPTEHFLFRVFAFRAIAGIYFGVIFLFRGFGITAGSHCAYDIIITLW